MEAILLDTVLLDVMLLIRCIEEEGIVSFQIRRRRCGNFRNPQRIHQRLWLVCVADIIRKERIQWLKLGGSSGSPLVRRREAKAGIKAR